MKRTRRALEFHLLSLFPKSFHSYLKESILKRAQEKGLIATHIHDLRDFSSLRHRKVDDKPYGGGPGMVLQVEPFFRALQAILKPVKKGVHTRLRTRVILFSTRGRRFNHTVARRLARYDRLVLLCGRYEGVDERVARHLADEEISLGDFVLSGGELPALVLLEAVARHVPGVLGTLESLEEKKGSYPTYSRPAAFSAGAKKVWKVPRELLSGDHKKIAVWRRKYSR